MNDRLRFLLPSIADIFFLIVFLKLSFVTGKNLLGDSSTGAHIRAGMFILDTQSVPKQDIFTFRSPSPPWIAHEWLSEVIMAIVHKGSGLTGIVIFFSFVIALVYSLLLKTLQTNKRNIIFTTLLVCLAIASSQLHWLARPHVFSLLLTVLWSHLLNAYQYNNKNNLCWLPLLMLLWVNLHGGFMLGFILLGVYLFGNLVSLYLSSEDEKHQYKLKVTELCLTAVACLLVSLINPYGYRILLFPIQLTSDRFLIDNIMEYASPNFHWQMPFRYLLFLTIAILAISTVRVRLIELVLILLMTHMALYSVRYILLFAIIVPPILLRQAETILDKAKGIGVSFFKGKANGIALIEAPAREHFWPLIAVLVVCVSAANGLIEYKFDERIQPVKAVEFLKNEKLPGHMFNSDGFGDYIIYAAWPQYRVFVDGRQDVYGALRMKEYDQVIQPLTGWQEILAKYDINWIIYNTNSALSTLLLARGDWRLIYADEIVNIFVRNVPENQPIISKYAHVSAQIR